MKTAICTLFEGDYHYGVGALTNSAYRNGFRGVVWAGYRGPLPPWAAGAPARDGYHEVAVEEGCVLRLLPVDDERHLTNYKPAFMQHLRDHRLEGEAALYYFDPDIVVIGRWRFFEEWVACGVALCLDLSYPLMPPGHPFRYAWRVLAERQGYEVQREERYYYNGGFVGVPLAHGAFLDVWADLLEGLRAEGVDLRAFHDRDRSYPYYVPDQDMLNLATMVAGVPVSALGQEGMEFVPGGYAMSHAAYQPKPWRRRALPEAVRGRPPGLPDRRYWEYADGPIRLYPEATWRRRWFEYRAGRALGMLLRRGDT